MALQITAIYASLLGLLMIYLATRVVIARRQHQVALGDNGNQKVEHAMRVHANSVEYVPVALILIAIFEINGGATWATHALGLTLLIARVLHLWGFGGNIGISFGRFTGTVLTWGVIIAAAVTLLISALRA